MAKVRAYGLAALMATAAAVLWVSPASAGGGGCYGGLTQGRGDTVEIVKACFTPSILEVEPGAEVEFVNRDPVPHNVVAPEWGYYENLGRGDSFTATFREEGTYPFACTIHPGMTGAVVVGDGSGPGSGVEMTVASATPASAERAAPSAATTDQRTWFGWLAGGVIGLGLGAGLTALVRRSAQA
ncbi:MAG TPA: plastocyanin/azurin family copper-binding protein [Actinomycetota bacterium]|nr:plastocyanin/azurin family copper-binding protein [Actinomycetota bacterium]